MSFLRNKKNNQERARTIEWLFPWSGGAPCPMVFAGGSRIFLTYYTDTPAGSGPDDALAIVEFIFPGSHRFGIVNDEAAGGHHLYEKGLQLYGAHIIENSSWIAELKKIHKVHPRFSDSHWEDRKHYLLFFKDEMFEIIAEDYKIEIFNGSLQDLAIEIAKRLTS
jgi:hypothetical protein